MEQQHRGGRKRFFAIIALLISVIIVIVFLLIISSRDVTEPTALPNNQEEILPGSREGVQDNSGVIESLQQDNTNTSNNSLKNGGLLTR